MIFIVLSSLETVHDTVQYSTLLKLYMIMYSTGTVLKLYMILYSRGVVLKLYMILYSTVLY